MLPKRFYLDSIFDNFMNEDSSVDMKCDVYEKDGNYHIEADIPGIDKKDINVECEDGYLTITATKEDNNEEENKNYIKKERFYGKCQRRFYVGDVDMEFIKASFNNGILKITIPKQPEKKSTKLIDIE